MSETNAVRALAASVDAAALPSKRKFQEESGSVSGSNKMQKLDVETKRTTAKAGKKSLVAKQHRLEQNRKAARNSRQRKKIMLEELQRSVVFFSRANSELKQQNEDLTRRLMQAQIFVSAASPGNSNSINQSSDPNSEGDNKPTAVGVTAANPGIDVSESKGDLTASEASHLKQANAVATQAMFALQGYSGPAARAAAMALNGGDPSSHNTSPAVTTTTNVMTITDGLPAAAATTPQFDTLTMQPGATMQAMSNFQQAATAAMKAAIGQMQSIPGLDLSGLDAPIVSPTAAGASTTTNVAEASTAAPPTTMPTALLNSNNTANHETAHARNVQQAYTDTMTAFALQKAAVDAATAASLLHPPFRLPYLPPPINNVNHQTNPDTSATN